VQASVLAAPIASAVPVLLYQFSCTNAAPVLLELLLAPVAVHAVHGPEPESFEVLLLLLLQVVQAFAEAEAHKGPSLIIAYAPCVMHVSVLCHSAMFAA
jgi:hypothetical protein